MKQGKFLILAGVVISMFMFPAIAFTYPSANLLYNETDLGGGLWQYDYRFVNTSTAGEFLYSVWLDFEDVHTITGLPLPTGWAGTFWEGTNETSYLDTFAILPEYEIAAGNYLSGFRFTIDYRAGSLPFTAYFDDHAGGLYVLESPFTIPEPISSILFLTGGAVLGFRRYLKRRRHI